MFRSRYTPLFLLLIGLFILSACAPAELEPIITRVTATPRPMTATPVPPTATAIPPTEAPADTGSGTSDDGAAAPTDVPAPTEVPIEGEDVDFNFVTPLSTIEELEPILITVEEWDGVLLASGSAVSISVSYDPATTDLETIMEGLRVLGHPVEVSN